MERIEKDFLGDVVIPAGKLYGACTQRTLNTCTISKHKVPLAFIRALLYVKYACATANHAVCKLTDERYEAIKATIRLLQSGQFDDQFELDIFQNGAGTSINMNVNEVVANLANMKFGVDIHPNNDVNMSQSSNDVGPSTLNVALSLQVKNQLMPALVEMFSFFRKREVEWAEIIKIGRTHMQDAVPMTLGQEMSGFARQFEKNIERCQRAIEISREIPLGGTAVGTGLDVPHGFDKIAVETLNEQTGMNFICANNRFCEQSSKDNLAEFAGILNAVASMLIKISKDIRILSSGPMAGIGELKLPATQAGSSIMAGKVNPAICEATIQAGYYVNGMMFTVLLGAENGELQVNTGLPVSAYALLDSIEILSNATNNLLKFCFSGMEPNEETMRNNANKSLMLAIGAIPLIGYEAAASVVKEALAKGVPVIDLLRQKNLMSSEEIDSLCNPRNMINNN